MWFIHKVCVPIGCAQCSDHYPTRIATQRNNPFDDYPALYGSLIGSAAAHLHYRALRQNPDHCNLLEKPLLG